MSLGSYIPSKGSAIYTAIQEWKKPLTQGIVLVVDPSIGSMSSMPGWAVYNAGQLMEAGILNIDPKGSIPERLREVFRQLRNLSKYHKPDVCVYEEIPVSAHGGRSQVGHASLLKAVGVSLVAVEARAYIGIMPVSWKPKVRDDYIKSDRRDAIEMGYIVISAAAEMITVEELRSSKKKGK